MRALQAKEKRVLVAVACGLDNSETMAFLKTQYDEVIRRRKEAAAAMDAPNHVAAAARAILGDLLGPQAWLDAPLDRFERVLTALQQHETLGGPLLTWLIKQLVAPEAHIWDAGRGTPEVIELRALAGLTGEPQRGDFGLIACAAAEAGLLPADQLP
jgi:hypothetical protein